MKITPSVIIPNIVRSDEPLQRMKRRHVVLPETEHEAYNMCVVVFKSVVANGSPSKPFRRKHFNSTFRSVAPSNQPNPFCPKNKYPRMQIRFTKLQMALLTLYYDCCYLADG